MMKDKTPMLPVHPHCLCWLSPVFKEEVEKKTHDMVQKGGQQYIDGLSETRKEQLLGVAGYVKYRQGKDWRMMARNYSPQTMKLMPKSDIIKLQIDGVGEAIIPRAKLTKYALNPEKAPDKAKAFKLALGYTLENMNDLIDNIKSHINQSNITEKGETQYGKRYQIVINLQGPNGKNDNVLTAWIDDKQKKEFRLTTIHVDKRGGNK